MSAEFGPGMIGAVVKIVTTNLKGTEIRTFVGRLHNYSELEKPGSSGYKYTWFQPEGEPDARIAFDDCHSSEVEVLAPSALDQQAMIADELQSLRTVFVNGDLFMQQLAGAR